MNRLAESSNPPIGEPPSSEDPFEDAWTAFKYRPKQPTPLRAALLEAKRCAEEGARRLAPYREFWERTYHGGSAEFRASGAGQTAFYGISAAAELEAAVRALDYALETMP